MFLYSKTKLLIDKRRLHSNKIKNLLFCSNFFNNIRDTFKKGYICGFQQNLYFSKNHKFWIFDKIIPTHFKKILPVQNFYLGQFYRFLTLFSNSGSNCKSLRVLFYILLENRILAYFTNITHKWEI